jgi:hypothetical protein
MFEFPLAQLPGRPSASTLGDRWPKPPPAPFRLVRPSLCCGRPCSAWAQAPTVSSGVRRRLRAPGHRVCRPLCERVLAPTATAGVRRPPRFHPAPWQDSEMRTIAPSIESRLAERDRGLPVWVRATKSGQEYYRGLSRGKLYQLASRGLIRSFSLRDPGNLKGCRFFHMQSILDYMERIPPTGGSRFEPMNLVGSSRSDVGCSVAALPSGASRGSRVPAGEIGSGRRHAFCLVTPLRRCSRWGGLSSCGRPGIQRPATLEKGVLPGLAWDFSLAVSSFSARRPPPPPPWRLMGQAIS